MKKHILAFLFLILSLCLFPQSPENFYWDSVWETSQKNSYFPLSLYDEKNAYIFYELCDKARQEIKIAWRQKEGRLSWSDTFFLEDSFKYSGDDVPDMYSAAISKGGRVAVSVLDSSSANGVVKVYAKGSSSSFSSYTFPPQKKQVTSSRIFSTKSGGFILFISLGEGKQSPMESSFSILYSQSDDGHNWSAFREFHPSAKIANAFSPFFTQIGNKDFVFFEGWSEKDSTTSMIYAASRSSNSDSWSEPFVVTDDSSMSDTSQSYLEFKNFRPFVLSDGENTKIIWERTSRTGSTGSVMVAPLSSDGRILDRNDVETLNPFGNGRRPSLFIFKGKFFALWFDDRNGVNNIHLAENLGVQWINVDSFSRALNPKTAASFPCAFILPDNSALSFTWQTQGLDSGVLMMSQDYYAEKPAFISRNFFLEKHGSAKNPSVKVLLPRDTSGLQGFCAISTFSEKEMPEKSVLSRQFRQCEDNILHAEVMEGVEGDQRLYFKACVLDKAGNWSDVACLEYYYDVTPPKKVSDIYFDKDEFGFASSNDVALSWKNASDESDEIAGYSYTLTKITPIDKKFWVSKKQRLKMTADECEKSLKSILEANLQKIAKAKLPGSKITSQKAEALFKNKDNGLYLFSVRAVDSVGNAGEAEQCVIFLNKYKAATQIKNIEAKSDDFGNVSIDISGSEFSYGGTITEVILTKKETGDKFVFNYSDTDYAIKKDGNDGEKITGIKISGMKAGTYTVQIRHSERGLSTWKNNLVIKENGTVKYEKQYNFEPGWSIIPFASERLSVRGEKILFWLLMFFIMLGIIACSRGVVVTARDAMKIRKEVASILTGDYMAKEDIENMEAKLNVRFSLKLKFGLLITGLLLLIVAGVALAIGYQMSRTQEKILIEGLKDRVKVVMGNMSSGVQSYLDDGREKLVEIGSIVNQTDNFVEAKNATILSYEIDGNPLSDGRRPMDYVWATNDENIVRKIDGSEFDAGTVRFNVLDENFVSTCESLNSGAKKIVEELSDTTGDKSNLIFKKLNEFSAKEYTSYPVMDDEKLDRNVTEYYFYWPVIYQKGRNNETFLQAMIFMEVSTDTLVRQIDSSKRLVMSIALIAAVLAAIIALVSAFALSSIIVSPIRRIVSHVKKITETKDKLLLEGVEIKITSRDELRTLGDSVNEMTRGLVKGAKDEERAKIAFQRAAIEREKAAKAQAEEAKARAEAAEMNIMNLDGQAVQKAFIPLVSEGAEKETVAALKEKEIQVFGYYEGTDAVSGDYFDFKKLDDRWYAFIKCDASGHGVPAALIMTIVATIFRRYFSDWKFEKNGVKLNLLAADINDFIESLGLRGKFAAMMICLLDTKTGDVYTCNAGDNILRVFDSAEKKIKVITLHEAPAAGPLPSFMVEMKGGYKVEKVKLKKDDVLFLYTDGIEESTRFFRNSDFEVVPCDEKGLKEGELHDTHKKGEVSEQMEPKRVQDVIEAVLNKKKYVLKRYHAPLADEKLEFDFSKCEGTIEDAIIALTAVEKVFRMYKKPGSQGKVEKTEMDLDGKTKTVIQVSGDGIKIDRKIDAFLAKYFNLYDYYCVNKVDEGETNYVYYTGVSEDVQADDLTLLAIKRM